MVDDVWLEAFGRRGPPFTSVIEVRRVNRCSQLDVELPFFVLDPKDLIESARERGEPRDAELILAAKVCCGSANNPNHKPLETSIP